LTSRFLALSLVLSALVLSACVSNVSKPEPDEKELTKRAISHTELALGYLRRDQLEVARSELERALEIKPDLSTANHVMANLQVRMRNRSEAEKYYKNAIRYDHENSSAMHDYAVFLCQDGRVKEAMATFDRALANPLYRGIAVTNLRAGECVSIKGKDNDRAEEYFRKALQASPRQPNALENMAQISYAKKNYLSARGYIERYFATGNETARSLLLAAQIEQRLGAKDVARKYAERLRSQFPSSDEAKQLQKAR